MQTINTTFAVADRSGEAPTAAIRRNEYAALPNENPASGFGWQVAFIDRLGRVRGTPYLNVPGKAAAEYLALELNRARDVAEQTKVDGKMPPPRKSVGATYKDVDSHPWRDVIKPWNPFDVYKPLACGQQAQSI